MRQVLKLAVAFLCEHRVRVALTSLATIAAAALVIWIANGYDALLKTFDEYSNLALGRYTLAIAPIATADEHWVPPEVVADLRAEPAIAIADPMWAVRAKVRPAKSQAVESSKPRPGSPGDIGFDDGPGSGPNARMPDSLLLATDSPEAPFDMLRGRWLATDANGTPEAVLRADSAQRFGVDVGDQVVVEKSDRKTTLEVVGIVNAPTLTGAGEAAIPILAPSSGELFVKTVVAQQIFDEPAKISLIGVSLQPQADLTAFRFGWSPRLNRYSTPVQFQEAYEIEEALDQAAAAQNVQLQAFAATGVGMLVALLVILSTLNMGVNERIRQYAVLRAVSFTRVQVGLLIVLEGLLLGAIGFLGGLAAGYGILKVIGKASSKVLYHGTELGTNSILLAALATFGGAFLASLVPAYRAMRVKPIDAMAPSQQLSEGKGISTWVALLALVLIALNPLLTFVFPPRYEEGVYTTMTLGFGAMALGFVLLTPAVVAIVDRWGTPLLSRLLGIDHKLLASQITSNSWRTAGAAISMAFGMALFVGIQVWGFTMLGGFIPGGWAPDALLAFRPDGLPVDHAPDVAAIPGIDPKRCQPIVVEQPRLLEDITHSADRASVTRQDNIVLVGIDPQGAFGGNQPLLRLEWIAGSPEQAIARMQKGHACVVPDHFLAETGLKVGDTITLVAPEDSSKTPSYEIAGAVRLPGWHWQTKLTGFRPRTHRAAALVFADYASVADDFDLPAASHVWFSYQSSDVDQEQIATAAQTLYSDVLGRSVTVGAGDGEPHVRLMPVQKIRDFLRNVAGRWIWVISQVPLVAMLIAGLGVLNVMLASVRSRHWEFGVLRSVGFTSGTLVRTVLAEGLLIGLIAGILSVSFGLLAGWCGCGIAQYISFFGGLHPSLVIPWMSIGIGLFLLLMLSTVAAVWPALSIGRARPLALLQQGRGVF